MSWQTVPSFRSLYLTPSRIFLHDTSTGGPADSSASLKCRVLFSVQFPFKDRKRKVHHHDVHPLAIFEAVSGRVLEQLMRTGMTSKGGIRPILTLEGKFHFTLIPTELGLTKSVGHPFHAAESYTERIFRGDNPYGMNYLFECSDWMILTRVDRHCTQMEGTLNSRPHQLAVGKGCFVWHNHSSCCWTKGYCTW